MSLKKETLLDIELHNASRRGDDKRIVQVLNTGRVHVDSIDEDGTTPLILSIVRNHASCVQVLLEEGADPNQQKQGLSPLFLASQFGFYELVRLLLKHGANIELGCKADGGTPLLAACQWGHTEVVKELIIRGANIFATMPDGATSVFLASQGGSKSILRILIEEAKRRLSRNYPTFVNASRRDGATPLFIAAQMGHLDCIRTLLFYGAEIDKERADGATPLFKAAHKGRADVVRELLKHQPQIGLLSNGDSALHAAAFSDNPEVVWLLLEVGSNPDSINFDGCTPLNMARAVGSNKVVAVLAPITKIIGKPYKKKEIHAISPTRTPLPRYPHPNCRRLSHEKSEKNSDAISTKENSSQQLTVIPTKPKSPPNVRMIEIVTMEQQKGPPLPEEVVQNEVFKREYLIKSSPSSTSTLNPESPATKSTGKSSESSGNFSEPSTESCSSLPRCGSPRTHVHFKEQQQHHTEHLEAVPEATSPPNAEVKPLDDDGPPVRVFCKLLTDSVKQSPLKLSQSWKNPFESKSHVHSS